MSTIIKLEAGGLEILDEMPNDPILPHRRPNGEFDRSVPMTKQNFERQWKRFEEKHCLKHLAPTYFRHWVTSTCRKAEMSKPARKAMRGHKHRSNDQDENYDNPQDSEILKEQARILPYGTIGYAFPKNIEVTQAVPPELVDALAKCLIGEMLPMQLYEMVTAHLVRQIKKPENKQDATMIL